MDINSRFREERQRLGLTQAQVGEAVGKSKRSVLSWEQDTSIPAEVLGAMVDRGMDVQYVLTGMRMTDRPMLKAAAVERGQRAVQIAAKAVEDLGFTCTAAQFKTLLGYAYETGASEEEMKAFIRAALEFAKQKDAAPVVTN